jgi:serine phosphatase RsbU (regulator of sigma subunit)
MPTGDLEEMARMAGQVLELAGLDDRADGDGLGRDGGHVPAEVLAARRLAAVLATGLLDSDPEEGFDDLARLAAAVAGGQRAFITVVDERRSFWKSAVGPGLGGPGPRENPVTDSPCQILIATNRPLIVDDAAADPRIRDLAAVGRLSIGAWAGFPIHSPDGDVLGGLCVLADVPRQWSEAEVRGLGILARSVTTEIGLRQSLHAATERVRELQESLLPVVLPDVPGLEAAAAYLPSGGAQVSGDFYDLFALRGGHWGAALGDVCGKGVHAAKLTALARYTLRAEATRHLSPAAVLARLNSALFDQQDEDRRFLTAVYATVHLTAAGAAGRLCTAGHPPALILRASGQVREAGHPGPLLGMVPTVTLQDMRFYLRPRETLLLYTDGITEARLARGPERPLFGDAALRSTLAGCQGLGAAGTLERIVATVKGHTRGQTSDDAALLALHLPAPHEPSRAAPVTHPQ